MDGVYQLLGREQMYSEKKKKKQEANWVNWVSYSAHACDI